MDEADKLSDRIAIMDYGKIIALDTPARLKEALEGDVITVKASDSQRLSSILAEKMSFQKIHVIDNTIEVTVRSGKNLLPRIAELAAQNNIYVESIFLREPNLDDVFLHYTGRTIRVDGTKERHGISAIKRRAIR